MIKLLNLIKNVICDGIKYIIKKRDYDDTIISILKHIGEYNIIFVKIFQWTRIKNNIEEDDFITQKISEEIYKYTNRTSYKEKDIDYKSLLEIYDISNKLGNKFELDSLKPINSGTISLIFKGKLNDKPVIVKLLRKDIKNELERGLDILVNIENFLYKMPLLKNYYNLKIFEENREVIIKQTDFENEVKNLSMIYKSFKDDNRIITPKPYEDYTKYNSNLIVMDYIEGKYLYELNNDELNKYFDTFLYFFLKSIFAYNIFHCDIHQGNILFINNSLKIGIIDMGMLYKPENDDLDYVFLSMTVFFNNNFLEYLEYIENNKILVFKNTVNFDGCIKYLKKLYNKKKIFYNSDIKYIIKDINIFFKILKKYQCIFYPKYTFFLLSLIPIFSILSKLGPNIIKKDIMNNTFENIINL